MSSSGKHNNKENEKPSKQWQHGDYHHRDVAAEVILEVESLLWSNNKGLAQPNGSLILTTLPPLIFSLELEKFVNNMGTTATSSSNEWLIWLVSNK